MQTFLTPLQEVKFQVLRDELGVSDSVLSKHLKQLEEAGYVAFRKGAVNGLNGHNLPLGRPFRL